MEINGYKIGPGATKAKETEVMTKMLSLEEAKRIWADVREINSEKLLHVRPKLKSFEAHHALEKSRLAFLDAWKDGRDEGQMRAAALAPMLGFKLKKGVHWAD